MDDLIFMDAALELAKQAKAMGVPDAARLVADIERRL